MKKLIVLIIYGMLTYINVSAQDIARFRILNITKIKNNCYKLTADNNGEKYIIYSHYDGTKNEGVPIHCKEYIDLKIIPFFETEYVSLGEIKESMGIHHTSEDDGCFGNITLPLNHKSIVVDYYGNKVKIKKKMIFHTLCLNGIHKIHE